MNRKKMACIYLVIAAVAASATPAGAEDPARWNLRFSFISVDPSGSAEETEPDGEIARFDFTSGIGVGGGGEYRFSDRLGLEAGLLSVSATDIVVRVTEPGNGRTSADHDYTVFRPLYVGLNYHLTPGRRLDLYAGPLVSYVFFEDIHFRYGDEDEDIEVDDDLAFGAVLGIDVLFGKSRRWSLSADLRYFETSLKGLESGGEPFELGYDPLILGFGFGYRL